MSKLGVLFAGAGWMGGELMRRVRDHEGAEVRALFQPDRAAAAETLRGLGLPDGLWTDNYEHALARDDIDAVFICSPNGFHGQQALQALERNRHVFCEKPCATHYAEYIRQIEAERAHPNLVTYVDYILYFDTMERRLRRMVADGAFGTVTQIQVNYRHPVNIAGEKAWKLDERAMGDAIGMGITHALSVMVWAMASQARPARVYATAMPAQVRDFEAPPIWNIQVTFDNGAGGVCLGNIDTANGYDAYHNLAGTHGAFIFDSLLPQEQKVRLWSTELGDGQWVCPLAGDADPAWGWPADIDTPDSGNVIAHQTAACVDHFIDCVRQHSPSPLSFANAAIIAELGWAARLSAVRGEPVDLPLSGDAAALDAELTGDDA